MPVDQYIGGAEHAVMHLLYARFFYMFMIDAGYVSGDDEPFTRLFNQGTLLRNGEKMSKSRGNVVGIDETVETYGVDAMRLFLLKAAPPEDALEWTDEGIVGRVRFIQRVWRACEPFAAAAGRTPLDRLPACAGDAQRDAGARAALGAEIGARRDLDAALPLQRHHGAARRTGQPAHRRHPRCRACRAIRRCSTRFTRCRSCSRRSRRTSPTNCGSAWVTRRRFTSNACSDADPAALAVDAITVVMQVNGKVRGRVQTAPGIGEDAVFALALAESGVQRTRAARRCASGSSCRTNC